MKIVSEFSKPNIYIKYNSNGIMYTVVKKSEEEKVFIANNAKVFKFKINLSWNPKRVKLRKTYSKNKKMICRLLRK